MAELLDNCLFTAGSMGTADFADGAADPTCRNLEDAGAEDGKVYPYKARNATGTEWEIGRGTVAVSGGTWTLERTTIQDSSDGGAKINFGTHPKIIITAGKVEIGDVKGSSSSVAGNLAAFSDTSGKELSDSGVSVASVLQIPDPVAMAIVFGGGGGSDGSASDGLVGGDEQDHIDGTPGRAAMCEHLAVAVKQHLPELYLLRHQEASGIAGGSTSSSAYTNVGLNTEVVNDIAGASLSSGVVTLPPGRYLISGTCVARATRRAKLELYDIDAAAVVIDGTGEYAGDNSTATDRCNVWSSVRGRLDIATETDFRLRLWTELAGTFGSAVSNGRPEVYAELAILRLGDANVVEALWGGFL